MSPELAERARREVFQGDWEKFEAALQSRLHSHPMYEKLSTTIRADLELIATLKGKEN